MTTDNGTSRAERFGHDPEMLQALDANKKVPLPIVGTQKPKVSVSFEKTAIRSAYTPVMRFLIRWSKMGFLRASSLAIATILVFFWGWGFQTLDFLRHFATFRWYVGDAEYARRMAACSVCPIVQVVKDGPKAGSYCGACGCPKWSLSDLMRKNRLRKHSCPAGFHGLAVGEKSETRDGE